MDSDGHSGVYGTMLQGQEEDVNYVGGDMRGFLDGDEDDVQGRAGIWAGGNSEDGGVDCGDGDGGGGSGQGSATQQTGSGAAETAVAAGAGVLRKNSSGSRACSLCFGFGHNRRTCKHAKQGTTAEHTAADEAVSEAPAASGAGASAGGGGEEDEILFAGCVVQVMHNNKYWL